MKTSSSLMLAVAVALALGGCVAIDDFSMFYTTDAAPSDSGVDGSPDGGDSSPPDTGTPDATPDAPVDGCVPVDETCNFMDDDCDGTVDEEPTECAVPNGNVACVMDTCTLLSCVSGFDGCDDPASCDTDLSDNRYHCGMCSTACNIDADCVDRSCLDSTVSWTVLAQSSVTSYGDAGDYVGDRIAIAGIYRSDIDVGTGSMPGSATENRIYVAQIAEDGTTSWVATSDAGNYNTVQAVALAPSGVTYVMGEVAESLTIDGTTVTTGASTRSVYVWVLDATGTTTDLELLEATSGTVHSADAGVSDDGTLYIAGWFSGSMSYGTGVTATSAGGQDMFLARRTSGGTTALYSYGTGGTEAIFAMDVDPMGGAVVQAAYDTGFSFGGTSLATPEGGSDALIAALDGSGGVRWAHTAGGARGEFSLGVAMDESRNVFFHTGFPPEMDGSGGFVDASFDTTGLVGAAAVIGSFAADGTLRWARPIGVGAPYWAPSGIPPSVTYAIRYRYGSLAAAGGMLYSGVDIESGQSLDGTTVIGESFSDAVGFIGFHGDDGSLAWAHAFGATRDFNTFDVAGAPTGAVVIGRFREDATIGTMTYTSPAGAFTGFATRVSNP